MMRAQHTQEQGKQRNEATSKQANKQQIKKQAQNGNKGSFEKKKKSYRVCCSPRGKLCNR
jgi:hypothetical protein